MRTSLVLSLLSCFVALIQAQSMPACAAECLGTSLANSTCDPTDAACICADVQLMTTVSGCTLASCTIKESLSARNATATLCGEPVRDNTAITPIITAVSGGLAIICVVLRIVDRYPHWSRLQWADLCVVLALVFAIPMGILEFFMSSDGFGKDIWTIPFDKITRIIQFTWMTEIFYMAVIGFTKAAILLLYLRVFTAPQVRTIIIVTIVVTAAYILAFTLTVVFHCTPVSFGWNGWSGEFQGRCINFNAFAWAHAIINIIFDIFIIALPIPELLKLHLSRRKLTHLILMFSVGFFITIVSIIRLQSLVQFANTANATYDNVPTAYWSVLEAFVSIICCCLPAIRALLRRIFPGCFGSTNDASYSDDERSYRISKSPLPSSLDSKKIMVGHHQATAAPTSGSDSDDIQLVPRGARDDNDDDGFGNHKTQIQNQNQYQHHHQRNMNVW